MQGAISIQVTADWVGMEGDKEDVIKLLWDKLTNNPLPAIDSR
jgi:hypothetical protein